METQHIAELIGRVTTGDPWHGSSAAQLLAGVSAADAARRMAPKTHSIWEIVLHMTGWTNEVRARLGGRAAQDPDGGDWPAIGPPTEERWRAATDAFFAAHRDLIAAVQAFDPAALQQPVVDFRPVEPSRSGPDERDRALGTGLSKYLTLHGLVHHTVYHSGQIGLLKTMVA